ncbi:hypothetical protein KDN24_06455 [Bacillus sp. Bva_UNVM-123]|uniref:hypothetical protein n=1 Tax=Bacillus sp. Bva_UNVM-123 TaxID=2829798 RepID=UPI00391FA3E8
MKKQEQLQIIKKVFDMKIRLKKMMDCDLFPHKELYEPTYNRLQELHDLYISCHDKKRKNDVLIELEQIELRLSFLIHGIDFKVNEFLQLNKEINNNLIIH